ncbi:MAG: NHL repeat-containing protein [Holophagaceae bacterium]|nr:NHL repeat-containing protein [Holophagaceae bacterium]
MRTMGRFARLLRAGIALSLLSAGPSPLGARGEAGPAGPISALPAPQVTPLRAYREGLMAPSRIATDAAGRVYITDHTLGKVIVRDEQGRLVSMKSGLKHPLGIAVDSAGRIYVGEEGTGSVSVFLPDWTLVDRLGQGAGEFLMPNHITIPASSPLAGMILVSDSRADLIKVYSAGGSAVRQFGGSGASNGQLNFPSGLYVSGSGEIFVADQNNNRIQVFSADGLFLRTFGRSTMMGLGPFSRTQGLAGDSLGRIFVADAFQGTVKVIDALGNAISTIGRFGEGLGELKAPVSLSIDRNNRLFVVSPGNTRVEIFGLDTFSDPKSLPADIKLLPATFDRIGVRATPVGTGSLEPNKVVGLLKVSGQAPGMILPESVSANGIAARRFKGAEVGDFDGDGIPELRVQFDRKSLVATLPDGKGTVIVKGLLADGRSFEGLVPVYVTQGGSGNTVPAGALLADGSGLEPRGGSQ